MRVDVLFTPRDVRSELLHHRAVAVFDVLRATTTMAAALAAGVAEIRIFDSTQSALLAARAFDPAPILCGERNCLPPPGFDLGNSPAGFQRTLHAGRKVFMSTTNGTRAIIAAREARYIFPAALVNASAVAARLLATGLDITLLCAGTDGERADEDLLGAGAVIDALSKSAPIQAGTVVTDEAAELFRQSRGDLASVMSQTTGGRNVISVGLKADLAFAAQLDSVPTVGQVHDQPLRVIPSS
jgi:2-phosphosulfolactate phosphatase